VAWATHPAAKGSRCWPGRGAPEPFASFFFSPARALFRAEPLPLIARSPPGTWRPGGASRRMRRHEESRSAAAEHEEGFFHAPFFVESLVESWLAAGTPRFRYSLWSGRSHPRAPPLLRPRSSRRTRVGKSVASATSLTACGAPNGGGLQQCRKLGTIPGPGGCQLSTRRSATSSRWPGPRRLPREKLSDDSNRRLPR
jgi:hypothetical protein